MSLSGGDAEVFEVIKASQDTVLGSIGGSMGSEST